MVNAVVLWNTRYMQRALDQVEEDGEMIRPEDIERLSPLGYGHVNLLGRYSFNLAEPLARGELRPLRNPADPEEQDDLLGYCRFSVPLLLKGHLQRDELVDLG